MSTTTSPKNREEWDAWERGVAKEVAEQIHEMKGTLPENGKDTNPKDLIGSLKPGVSCVPTQVWALVGLAMAEGQKYGRHNYRAAGVRASVYYDAVFRHFFLQWWDKNEDIDSASGLHHIVKTIAGLVVLMDSILQGNFVDDRPPKAELTMEELQARMDGVLDSLKKTGVLPAWTEKRMQETAFQAIKEKEHIG